MAIGLRGWVVVVLSMVVLVGCGNEETATPAKNAAPTATTVAHTATPPATATSLPPSWTPAPTFTTAAGAEDVTLPTFTPRPTSTSFTLPTYTPHPDIQAYVAISAGNASQLAEIVRRHDYVYDFAWGPDGTLAVAMQDGARLYSGFNLSETPRLLRDVNPSARAYKTASVAFSPDGNTVATGNTTGEVRVWDSETQSIQWTLPDHSFDVNDLVFAVDGTTLYAASFDNTIRVWNTDMGELLRTIDLGEGTSPYRLALHPVGSPLLASSVASERLYVWDAQTGALLTSKPAARNAIGLALSPGGQHVAYADRQSVLVWELAALTAPDGEPLAVLDHEEEIWEVAYSPDGSLLAVGLADGTVQLWDARRLERVERVQVTDFPIRVLAFSPDGKFLLTGSPDGLWTVWGVQN